MAQHLHRVGKLNSPRRERFSVKFMKDLETLICNVAVEIAERHIKVDIFRVYMHHLTVLPISHVTSM